MKKEMASQGSYLLIGIVVIALLLLMVFFMNSFGQTKVPQSPSDNKNPTATAIPTTVAPSVIATATATPHAIPADKTELTSNGAAMQFTSYDLGITFIYPKKGVTVKRMGMKVFVGQNPSLVTDGQYVEVFTKSEVPALTQILQSTFLVGYNAKNCFVADAAKSYTYPVGYEVKSINTPTPTDMEDLDKKVALCPQPYTASNGISYFVSSTIRKDRYAFLSIGQYAIGGKTNSDTWQETLRFLAK